MLTEKRGRPRITDMNATLVGQEVRRARNALGLTLAQVSEMSGIPLRTVHGLETGETKYPSEQSLRAIASVLCKETTYRHLALLVYGETEAETKELATA